MTPETVRTLSKRAKKALQTRTLSKRAKKALQTRLQRPGRPRLRLEQLEDRTLMTISASISGNTLTFTGGLWGSPGITGDNVWLKSSGGFLNWSYDGTSYFNADSNKNQISLVS